MKRLHGFEEKAYQAAKADKLNVTRRDLRSPVTEWRPQKGKYAIAFGASSRDIKAAARTPLNLTT